MVRSNGGREEGEGGSTKRETQKRSKREGVSECVRAVLCCAVLCWYVPGRVSDWTGLAWSGCAGTSRPDETGVAARKVRFF